MSRLGTGVQRIEADRRSTVVDAGMGLASAWKRVPTAPVLAGLLHLVLVLGTAAVAVWRSSGRQALRPDLEGPARYLVSPLALWDGGWYTRIVVEGYGETEATAAFWPLYPWLIEAVSWATGWGIASSGVVISNLAFLAALVVLYRLVALSYGDRVAGRTVWLVALCPVAFFFSALYTESIFLLLSAGAVLQARRGRWTSAALLALPTTLTRSAGVLVFLPIGVALVEQMGWNPRRLWGDPLLMVRAQSHWHRGFSAPWETLWTAFRRTELTYVTGWHACFDAVSAGSWPRCRDALGLGVDSLSDDLALASALVALVLLPYMVRRLVVGDVLYAVTTFAFFLSSGTPDSPLISVPRYLLVVYPFFVVLALLLRRRLLFAGVVGASAVGLCWLLSIFARAYFVA